MKWENYRIDQAASLSPDLEWMLQSRQVSLRLLLESMAEAYYVPIYRLALTFLDDRRAARKSVKDTFLKAALSLHHYRSDLGVDAWLYTIAWRVIRRERRRERVWGSIEKALNLKGELTDKVQSNASSDVEIKIWQSVDELREIERNLALLHYANSWSFSQISKITGITEAQVSEKISFCTNTIANKSLISQDNIGSTLSTSLQKRWQISEVDDDELSSFIAQIEQRAGSRHGFRARVATAREMAIIGFAILLIALVIWGGNRFLLQPAVNSTQPGAYQEESRAEPRGSMSELQATAAPSIKSNSYPTRTPFPTITSTPSGIFYYVEEGDTLASIAAALGVSEGEIRSFNRIPDAGIPAPGKPLVIPGSIDQLQQFSATPVTPFVHSSTPYAVGTSADVHALLNPEVDQFHTLWLDAQILRYKQGDRSTQPEVFRAQLWLSHQQLLIISGPDGEEPYEVGIGNRRGFYYARPGEGQYWFHNDPRRWTRDTISIPVLYGLMALFGDTDESIGSRYEVIGESRIAGRDTWVVNQANATQDRLALLWIDKETGLILRANQLSRPRLLSSAGEYLPSDVTIQAISYDVDFPQDLFAHSIPWRGGYARDFSGQPEEGVDEKDLDQYTVVEPANDIKTPPSGFSIAESRLSFSYPIGSYLIPSMAGTNIYADGYYLGRIRMGIPWEAACQRSPDGSIIVFSTPTSDKDDQISLSKGLYYVSLKNLEEVVRLLPPANQSSDDFAISPDSRYIAFWGCERNGAPCGLYLHDIADRSWRRIVELAERTEDFVWSPDGKFIAMVVDQEMLTIVRAADGEIIAENLYDPRQTELPVESAVFGWGVEFPPPDTGLESCVPPPGR